VGTTAPDARPEAARATPSPPRDKGVHPRNSLNDLSGRQWLRFTRSWDVWDSKRYHQNRNTELHPARYPEEMVREFVQFFTKAGEWVLDPFAGSGATLVACSELGRSAVGVEVSPKYAHLARSRLAQLALGSERHVIEGDARSALAPEFWGALSAANIEHEDGLPLFDFVMTSPPYWNMLRTSRGGVKSTHKERAEQGLDTHYSDSDLDLGNVADYDQFVEAIGGVFDGLHPLLRQRRYLVCVVQNLRAPEGEVKPLAWDLCRRLSQTYLFQGEKIWCQNTKKLGIWGYPTTFVPNYHHHYCLIFRKV